jgi:hypothetical protein
VLLLHLVMHLSRHQYHASGLPTALSFYPLSVESHGRLGSAAMQFLNALAGAALASSAIVIDVNKAAFISGALRELGVTLCVVNKLAHREAMHVYAAAGGTRARMGLHASHVCCSNPLHPYNAIPSPQCNFSGLQPSQAYRMVQNSTFPICNCQY